MNAFIIPFRRIVPIWGWLSLSMALSAQIPDWSLPQPVAQNKTTMIGTGDFNGDGLPDIGLARSNAALWYPAPALTTPQVIGTADGSPYGGTVADMNGDGWPDIVATDNARDAGPGELFVFIHPGNAANAAVAGEWRRVLVYSIDVWHQNDLEVADMDGDGRPDIIVRTRSPQNRVVIAFQNADISAWTTRSFATGETASQPEGLGIGDITGDGSREIVLSGVFWDNPNWRTGAVTEHMIDPAFVGAEVKSKVGDLNGDGLNDIVMSKAEGNSKRYLAWYRNTGNPKGGEAAWEKNILWDNVTNIHALAIADFNGDGLPDIFAGQAFADQTCTIFYNQKQAASWVKQTLPGPVGMYVVSVVDLDGDGNLDLVGPRGWNDQVNVRYNLSHNGTGPASSSAHIQRATAINTAGNSTPSAKVPATTPGAPDFSEQLKPGE
jgi:hypothetical protein